MILLRFRTTLHNDNNAYYLVYSHCYYVVYKYIIMYVRLK